VPTTENVAREIFRRLKPFPAAKLERVRIEETSKNSFEFSGDEPEARYKSKSETQRTRRKSGDTEKIGGHGEDPPLRRRER
jgi:hypothetical protein